MVQPWSLYPEIAEEVLSCAGKLRARGVFVACLTDADNVPERFVKASDMSFFMRTGLFARLTGISKKEASRLCPEFVFLDSDYAKFVPLFDNVLEKRGIDHVLVVGGFKEACVLSVAKSLCRLSRIKGLKIRLVERLLMSGYRPYSGLDLPKRLVSYSQASGCDISVLKSDPEFIYLKYFR